MSGTRADRLERLQGLQKKKREIEEWRLAALEQRAAFLKAEAEAILTSLSDPSPLAGLFIEAKAASLRRKEAERASVEDEAVRARARLRAAGAIEKRLGRVASEARTVQTREEEARSLAEILDAHASARRASLE